MNIVILGSGRGSNAEAILKAQATDHLGNGNVVLIVSDRRKAPILKLGSRFDVPASYLYPGPFKTKLDGEALKHYVEHIQKFKPDLIVLAGFMRIVKPAFIEAFEGKIINLHPSLLPSFKGLNSIRRAFDYGVKYTGCTVHWVVPEIDAGPILDQAVVRIETNDTCETLEEKVHAAEHRLLPQVIERLSRLSSHNSAT